MAPLKYEEELRNKLEKRRLQPSKNAWEKLSNKLDTEEKRNQKTPYWWLGLAASIIGVVLVVSQFFDDKTKVDDTIKIVETPEVIQQEQSAEIVSENLESQTLTIAEENPAETNKAQINKNQQAKKAIKSNPANYSNVATLNDAEYKIETGLSEKEDESVNKAALTFEEQQIKDVIAQVKLLKEHNNEVTDAEIDALLLKAQKEIRLNKLVNETTGMVDANRLLQDVEAELDQSFRAKVLEAIKASYNSVKTAVAQRNK